MKCTSQQHEAMKLNRAVWQSLGNVQHWPAVEEGDVVLEQRDCLCGSSIARVVGAPFSSTVNVDQAVS